jgi:aryl-alcohol dehydrogenase-like predicted oxidoreductase
MNFGPQTDEADSHAIMDAALGSGIKYFDRPSRQFDASRYK